MTFGERLRQLREERNLTQKAIAGIIGISPRMVSFYESGAHFPREEGTLLKLAQFFEVSTDYLLGYSDVRCVEQLRKLNQAFQGLPRGGTRKSDGLFGLSVRETEASEALTALRRSAPAAGVSWSAHEK